MHGGVALAFGGEGDFRNSGKARQIGFVDAELACRDDQRAFRRVALYFPAILAVRQRRVIGERRRTERLRNRIANRRGFGERRSVDAEVALRNVATAADLDERPGREDRPYRHFVSGQRAGLVGADHRRSAERLDGRKLSYDGIGGRHAPHAEAQPNGDDGRQRLGDRRDRERHGEQEQAENRVQIQDGTAEQPRCEHHGANSEHDRAKALAGAVKFLLKRRRLLLGGFQQTGDAADLGPHAGRDDHGAATAIGRDRARKQHVAAVAEADIGVDRLRLLRHRHALAGQGSLVDVEIGAFDDPGVRRNLVPGFDQHDVARHDVVSRDALALAVTNHRRFGSGKRHQGANRALRPRLLEISEHGVQHDDRQDDDGLVGQRALAWILQQPLDPRNNRRDEQDDDKEILELLDEPPPPWRFRRALQLVRSVLVETPLRLGAAQAARRVGPECRDDRFNRFTVRRRRNTRLGRARPGRVFSDVILLARLGKGLQHWSSCAHEVAMRWVARRN